MKQIALFIVLTFFVLNTQAKKPIENKINIQKNISTKIKPMNWFPTVRSLKPSLFKGTTDLK